ncbi:MAG TPA: type II secretion system protein [Pyrinomonadaceae bacterium]|nr:type II secretion system protein [Pyrinomonadaceae bacterium]
MTSRKPRARTKRPATQCSLSPLKLNGEGRERAGERGYTLVAVLAVMTIMLLLITAAVPSIRQQAQRTREEEAIERGEEVAEAIRLYVREKGTLPTSIDQLLEGIPRGTKKLQILRPTAAHDPLSNNGDGEWKLIRKNDAALLSFQRAVTVYAGRTPDTRDQRFLQVAGPLPLITNILDTDTKEEAPGGEDTSENSSGPFIGVTSRSKRASIITYYGIDRHDQWVFTPYFK